jgi:hypothetical protein
MEHTGNSSDYWVKRQWKWTFLAKQRGMVGQKSQLLAHPCRRVMTDEQGL